MAQLAPNRVFKGFWIDHEKGVVLGSTITTSAKNATVIVAILSLLIAFTGKYLWSIIAAISSRMLAHNAEQDISRQEQSILLQHGGSPVRVFIEVCRMRKRWRHLSSTKRALYQIDLFVIAAAVCSVGFVVAGILSSQVVTAEDIIVLAWSSSCGFTSIDYSDSLANLYDHSVVQETVDCTHRCYNGSRTDSGCQIYKTHSIPYNATYDTCPFEGLCTLAQEQALKLDTGLLWSDEIFGINTPRKDALAMRQVTKCAPLNTTQYQKTLLMDDLHAQQSYSRKPLAEEHMVNLNLGRQAHSLINDTSTATSVELNTSMSYGFAVAYWSNQSTNLFSTSPWSIGEGFDPIQALQSTQDDLTLLMLTTNTLEYDFPIDDPFYSAHQPHVFETRDAQGQRNYTHYRADQVFSVIGCTQQYHLCTGEDDCTDLSYVMTATSQIASRALTPFQNVTLYSYASALINHSAGFWFLFKALSNPLLAKDAGGRAQTHGLPTNQWELEVRYWTSIVLNAIQRYIADFSAAQDDSYDYTQQHYRLPPGPAEQARCHAQKMRAPVGISNISVFGLSFTIGVCAMIILLNLVLMRMICWISKTWKLQWKLAAQTKQKATWQTQKLVWENDFVARPDDKICKTPELWES